MYNFKLQSLPKMQTLNFMILKDFMSLCVFYEFMCTPFCQKVYIEFIHLAKKFKLKFYEFMCKHFCQKFLFAISANIKFYDFEWFYEFTHLVKKFKLKFYEFMCKPFCQKFLFAIGTNFKCNDFEWFYDFMCILC